MHESSEISQWDAGWHLWCCGLVGGWVGGWCGMVWVGFVVPDVSWVQLVL